MTQPLRMPKMGNTMEMGVVVEWQVEQGETVSEGDVVVVVESEKASQELVADQDGVLERIFVTEAEQVPPGTRLGVVCHPDDDEPIAGSADHEQDARIETGGHEDDARSQTTTDAAGGDDTGTDPDSEPRIPAAPGARRRAREESIPLPSIEGTGPGGAVLNTDIDRLRSTGSTPVAPEAGRESGPSHVFAPPRVRRLARERGIDLDALQPPGGTTRITEADVRALESVEDRRSPTVEGEPADRPRPDDAHPERLGLSVSEDIQLGGIQATIARRMARSAREKPHVTVKRTVDVETALSMLDEFGDASVEPGITDLLVCAVSDALETYPRFNSWYSAETIHLIDEINIGTAVDITDGLVTPVLENTGQKDLFHLTTERKSLTEAVRSGDYTAEDLQGGTFTITSLGMFGVDSFDPIIDPPQIAILGVGRIRDSADGRELDLSLSFDHRAVNGADAAKFLGEIAGALSRPTRLITGRYERDGE